MHDIIIALLSGVSVAVITQAGQYIRERKAHKDVKEDKESDDYKALKAGLVAVMHDIIYSRCEAAIAEGEISVDDLQNIEILYIAYHNLGGNGTGTSLYKRVAKLPIMKGEIK